MNQQPPVYDLGEIGDANRKRARRFHSGQTTTPPAASSLPRAATPVTAPVMPAVAIAPAPRRNNMRPNSAIAATLSLFVPGSGQALSGRPKLGLFFFCMLGLFASSAWAVVQTLDRLNHTAALLGAPRQLPSWLLVILFASAAATHMSAVLNAHDLGEARRGRVRPLPLISTLASLLVPGWGQVLNGDRVRAVMFLGGLWHLVGAWIVLLPMLRHLLDAPMLPVRPLLLGPVLLLCSTCVLWTLAVYDAASSATMQRLES